MRSWNRLALAVLLAGVACACHGSMREARVDCVIHSPPVELWRLHLDEKFSRGGISFLESSGQGEKLDLKVVREIEEGTARIYSSDETAMFLSLFSSRRTGYPGQHTKYIECPDEFKPEFFQTDLPDGFFNYSVAHANSNHVAGACSEDLAVYRVASGFLYCRSLRTLIELDYYVPRGQPGMLERFLGRVGCELSPSFRSFLGSRTPANGVSSE